MAVVRFGAGLESSPPGRRILCASRDRGSHGRNVEHRLCFDAGNPWFDPGDVSCGRPIVLGFIAISTGMLCAIAGTLLIFGNLHVIALLFGVSLIGISVDYCLQYFCEYFDPGAKGPSSRLVRVLPGVAMGVATTIIGYLTLLLAPFPGLRQVAVLSVIGIAASSLTVVLWFPILDRQKSPGLGDALVRAASRHWELWRSAATGRRVGQSFLCADRWAS